MLRILVAVSLIGGLLAACAPPPQPVATPPESGAQYLDRQAARLEQALIGSDSRVERDGNRIVITLPAFITFDVDSADLRPEVRPALDAVAATLVDFDLTFADIIGHTDSSGDPVYNQNLSEQRARVVADHIVAGGVPAARVNHRGEGELNPVASNATPDGRELNRRVEIVLTPVT